MALSAKIKRLLRKVVLIQIFMCFIALALWGQWLVYVIDIITLKEFLHVLTAPITLFTTTASFFINIKVLTSKIKQMENYDSHLHHENLKKAQHSLKFIQNYILVSLVPFNLVGPLIGMSMLYYPGFGFFIDSSVSNPLIVYVGAFTATGLSFLFFIPFINSIMTGVEEIGCKIQIDAATRLKTLFQNIYRLTVLGSIGIILLIGTTVLSVTISTSPNSPLFTHVLLKKTIFISFVVLSGIFTNSLSFKGRIQKMEGVLS